jgi:hypothetical protein
MEGEREETCINTEQQGENIASALRDGQGSEGTDTALNSTPECHGKPIESNEGAFNGRCFVEKTQ